MDWVCDIDGGVQKGCRRAKYWPPTGVVGTPARVGAEGCAKRLGFKQG